MIDRRDAIFSVTKKDLHITYFSGTGAGGQHRNRHMNCCRIHHSASGVTTTGQDERSKMMNTKNAFLRLTKHPIFQSWLRLEVSRCMSGQKSMEEELDEIVAEAMREENLKIEEGGVE